MADNQNENLKAAERSDKYKYIYQNINVKRHSQRRRIVMGLIVFLLITILLGGSVYAMLSYIEYNNFKVLIDKQGYNILSLSNNSLFSNPSEVLSLGGPKYMDNITLMDIYHKIPDIIDTDGNYDAGDEDIKFIASTFYLKNVSEEIQTFREAIIIDDITRDIDKAIRVMVIRDGEMTVYAKAKGIDESGTPIPEEVVPGELKDGIPMWYFSKKTGKPTAVPEEAWIAEPFLSDRHILYNAGLTILPGETKKYTMLIWLEGWDPDCIDERLGGTIKMELQFTQEKG